MKPFNSQVSPVCNAILLGTAKLGATACPWAGRRVAAIAVTVKGILLARIAKSHFLSHDGRLEEVGTKWLAVLAYGDLSKTLEDHGVVVVGDDVRIVVRPFANTGEAGHRIGRSGRRLQDQRLAKDHAGALVVDRAGVIFRGVLAIPRLHPIVDDRLGRARREADASHQ